MLAADCSNNAQNTMVETISTISTTVCEYSFELCVHKP